MRRAGRKGALSSRFVFTCPRTPPSLGTKRAAGEVRRKGVGVCSLSRARKCPPSNPSARPPSLSLSLFISFSLSLSRSLSPSHFLFLPLSLALSLSPLSSRWVLQGSIASIVGGHLTRVCGKTRQPSLLDKFAILRCRICLDRPPKP